MFFALADISARSNADNLVFVLQVPLQKCTQKSVSPNSFIPHAKVSNNGVTMIKLMFYLAGHVSSTLALGVDRYVFFRADADTDYYRSSRPITDILNRYTCLV